VTRSWGAGGNVSRGTRGAGGSRGESIPPTDESSSWCVRGERRRRGERDVRRCRSTLHRRTHSRQEGGWREEVAIHVAQMGTLPPEDLVERGMRVVKENTLPRCTEGYRLLTRRAGRGG
jgi:hypothetical protein